MNEKEFVDMIINERIGHLLGQEQKGKEDPVADRGEEILNELEEEKRVQLEEYMNCLVETTAQHERYLYLEGFRDGVRLMMRLARIERHTGAGDRGMEDL